MYLQGFDWKSLSNGAVIVDVGGGLGEWTRAVLMVSHGELGIARAAPAEIAIARGGAESWRG